MTENLQIDEILEAFKYFDGVNKSAAVEAALARKSEITPHLIGILEDALEKPEPHTEDPDRLDHIYAFMLLGHFKEPAAHKVIVDLFSLPPDLPYRLFGDIGLTHLPSILVDTCGGSLERIKALAENRKADIYPRAAAMDAMGLAVLPGFIDRREVLSFYEHLFNVEEAEPGSDFWGLMAMSVVDLYPMEIMDTIRRAYEEGLINPGMIRFSSFEKAVAEGPEAYIDRLKLDYRSFSVRDIHAAMSAWPCFQPEAHAERRFSEPLDLPDPDLHNKEKAAQKKKKAARKKRKMAKASKRKNRK